MIKSMTGFGQSSVTAETFKVTIDLRSVNNRNLDIHWRAPMELAALEIPSKKHVQAVISRGRVDVNINFTQTVDTEYEINRPLVRGYLAALRTMREEFGLAGEATLDSIARLPNVLQNSGKGSQLSDEVVHGIETALQEALAKLVSMRAVEGEQLHKELNSRIDKIEAALRIIEVNAPDVTSAYRDKLNKRLSELLESISVDETRLAQEVAYLAERADISEEITRLNSHLVQLRELVNTSNEIGKKLDFLLQETNREANTILSKASELAICDAAIEIKTEVEKLREQANNVE